MKYMIMLYGAQQDYDAISGVGPNAWSAEDVAALHTYMGKLNNELIESGEFVDAQGLANPVHARRISLRNGVPVSTDGPYAETQEVLAGYTTVECESLDRATEIAARLADPPHPPHAVLANEPHVDIRPIGEAPPEPEV